jgi:CBS domain-containing protein
MAYSILRLLGDRSKPVTCCPTDLAGQALARMDEHDFSQLPVVDENQCLLGLVTIESILRAILRFNELPTQWRVSDCMEHQPRTRTGSEELSSLLRDLEDVGAVVIIDGQRRVIGIVTDYDTAKHFREKSDVLLLLEDVESTLRELIRLPFRRSNGDMDETALSEAISAVVGNRREGNSKRLEELTLFNFQALWLEPARWHFYKDVVQLDRRLIEQMLKKVRDVRNKAFHFRDEISRDEVREVQFCRDWLERALEDLQPRFIESEREIEKSISESTPSIEESLQNTQNEEESVCLPNQRVPEDEALREESKYAGLSRWLIACRDSHRLFWAAMKDINSLVRDGLPDSAFTHRAWWANASDGHSQAKSWLGAGWEVDLVDMNKHRVRFRRIEDERSGRDDPFEHVPDIVRDLLP